MPEAADVVGEVRALFDDAEFSAVQSRMRDVFRRIYNLQMEEDLPEHFTRGPTQAVRVATLNRLASGILADTRAFSRSVTVVPTLPPYTMEAQKGDEQVEKWLAMLFARQDEGKRFTQDMRWHLLLDSYCCPLVRCGDPKQPDRWTFEIPEPLTCAFPMRSAPFRPSVFAREYKMLARDVEKRWGGERGYSDDWKPYMKADGAWSRCAVTDDYPVDHITHGNLKGLATEVTIRELDDGENIWVSVSGGGDKTKDHMLVSKIKNLTGGCRAVVVSMGATPQRDKYAYQPGLYPVYQLMLLLNNLRAMRASRSANAKPDVLVNASPEQVAAMGQASGDPAAFMRFVEQVRQFQTEGGPQFIYLPGDAKPWELLPDPELDKMIIDIKEELAETVSSYQQTANEKVIQEANTNVFLPYAENVRNKQAPLLDQTDWATKMLLEMVLHSLSAYGDKVPYYATGEEVHGEYRSIQRGETVELDAGSIDLDRIQVRVATQAITAAERRALIQDYAYRESIGVSSHMETLTAGAGYSDGQEQAAELAKDAGLKLGMGWNEQVLAQTIQERLRLRARIFIPNYGMPQPVMPAEGGGQTMTYTNPAIGGGGGDSGATVGAGV